MSESTAFSPEFDPEQASFSHREQAAPVQPPVEAAALAVDVKAFSDEMAHLESLGY